MFGFSPSLSARWLRPVAVAVVCVVGAAACSPATTGRELGPETQRDAFVAADGSGPDEVQSVIPLAEAGVDGFELLSPSFEAGAELSEAFTSVGVGLWPAFTFVNVPPEAVELVLVATDVDNSNFVHWIVSGIPATTPGFGEGELPPGVVEHRNGAGQYGWFAPSKALGTVHRYRFQLYALATPLGLNADHETLAVLDTLDRQNISRSSLLGILIG